MTTCPSWPAIALQVPPDQQVERLIGASELDVRPHDDRVVPLHEGIEEFVQTDRDARAISLLEVVTLEHPGHRHARREPDHLFERQPGEPFAVSPDLGP